MNQLQSHQNGELAEEQKPQSWIWQFVVMRTPFHKPSAGSTAGTARMVLEALILDSFCIQRSYASVRDVPCSLSARLRRLANMTFVIGSFALPATVDACSAAHCRLRAAKGIFCYD